MSDFNKSDSNDGSMDDDGFDDFARRAGRGLGAITPNRPAASSVRKRVARRRTATLGSVAAGLVVAIVAVNANNNSDGSGPKVLIATAPSLAPPTSTVNESPTTNSLPLSGSSTTVGEPTTTIGATTTTTAEKVWITVDTPTSGMSVPAAGPLLVSGTAKTFESTVNIKVYDDQRNLILETFTTAAAPDIEPGPYSISIEFPAPVAAHSGTLEVFEYSAQDGTEIHKVIVPIVFMAA